MSPSDEVALCLFGQMRSYRECYKYLQKYLIDELSPDIFIHTWEKQGGTWKEDGNRNQIESTIERQELDRLYSPIDAKIETFEDHYYTELKDVRVPEKVQELAEVDDFQKGMIPMFYKMHCCNKLKKEHESRLNTKYDLVIFLRPDLLILENIPSRVLENPNVLWSTGQSFYYNIDDKFLISSSENMDYVSSIWDRLNEYWASELGDEYGHMGLPKSYSLTDGAHIGTPERLLHYHLKQSPIETEVHDIDCRIIRQQDRAFIHAHLSQVLTSQELAIRSANIIREEGIHSFFIRFIRFLRDRI